MPSRLTAYAVGVALALCAGLALAGFGRQEPGPVAALMLSLVVAGGGFYLRKRPEA